MLTASEASAVMSSIPPLYSDTRHWNCTILQVAVGLPLARSRSCTSSASSRLASTPPQSPSGAAGTQPLHVIGGIPGDRHGKDEGLGCYVHRISRAYALYWRGGQQVRVIVDFAEAARRVEKAALQSSSPVLFAPLAFAVLAYSG